VAQTASEQTQEVAGAVKEQAAEVVQSAKEQGRNVAHEAREQLRVQANSQTQRLAEALRGVGTQVQALADGRTEEAGGARDYARQAAGTVQEWAGRVESRGFQGLTRDLEQVARRRPGAFLAGAATAGFLIGRLLRSSSASASGAGESDGAAPRPGGQTAPPMAPAAPLILPTEVPPSPVTGEFAPIQTGPGTGSPQVR
jgi:hypothetical protein